MPVRRGHNGEHSVPGYWSRWLAASALGSLMLAGCASFWDDVTSRDYDIRSHFVKEDPLVVLRDSKDGNKRARAYRALKEPKTHGGSDRDQDFLIELLTAAARTEPQFYPRLMAIQKLGEFKDPRAVAALVGGYYEARAFLPDKAKENMIHCQVLTALGKVGHPSGLELLVTVLRQGPVEGPQLDRQMALDERIAAARALANFPGYQATEALAQVMKREKDVALREAAHEAIVTCTGQKLPRDYQAWDELLQQQRGDTQLAGKRKGFMELILATFQSEP
jgi:HEAT repeat protein